MSMRTMAFVAVEHLGGQGFAEFRLATPWESKETGTKRSGRFDR